MNKTLNHASLFRISQATTTTFVDLYFEHSCLFFIQSGSKTITMTNNLKVTGYKGDLFICPAGSLITLKNKATLV